MNTSPSRQHDEPRALPWRLASQPIAWLCAAALAIILVCAGVALALYLQDDRRSAIWLTGRYSPGAILAFAGGMIAAVAILVALSLLALRDATSPRSVVLRGTAVGATWVAVATAAVATMTYSAVSDVEIRRAATVRNSAPRLTAEASSAGGAASPAPPGVAARVTLTGTVTLDGVPFDAQFLGANVRRRDGLRTACQLDIVPVAAGRYRIVIVGDEEVRGCGISAAEVVLWTSAADKIIFSREAAPWPGDGASATFDTSFSTVAPAGAATPATEIFGEARNPDGSRLPAGAVVEAYIGGVRCGVASTRTGAFEGFVLIIAGPESIPACERGATITFRVNGRAAKETIRNELGPAESDNQIDLTLQ